MGDKVRNPLKAIEYKNCTPTIRNHYRPKEGITFDIEVVATDSNTCGFKLKVHSLKKDDRWSAEHEFDAFADPQQMPCGRLVDFDSFVMQDVTSLQKLAAFILNYALSERLNGGDAGVSFTVTNDRAEVIFQLKIGRDFTAEVCLPKRYAEKYFDNVNAK